MAVLSSNHANCRLGSSIVNILDTIHNRTDDRIEEEWRSFLDTVAASQGVQVDELRSFQSEFEHVQQQQVEAAGNADLQESLDNVAILAGRSDSFGAETRRVGRAPHVASSDEDDEELKACESFKRPAYYCPCSSFVQAPSSVRDSLTGSFSFDQALKREVGVAKQGNRRSGSSSLSEEQRTHLSRQPTMP